MSLNYEGGLSAQIRIQKSHERVRHMKPLLSKGTWVKKVFPFIFFFSFGSDLGFLFIELGLFLYLFLFVINPFFFPNLTGDPLIIPCLGTFIVNWKKK